MLRRAALVLLTVSVLGTAAEPLRSAPMALAEASAMDSTRARPVAPVASVPDSTRRTAKDSMAARDTSLASLARSVSDTSKDTTKVRKSAIKDTVAVKKTLSPRLLGFDDQLLFALVFMSYIALMLTSMTNLNP